MKLNELFENKKKPLNEAIGDTSVDVYSSQNEFKLSVRNLKEVRLESDYRSEFAKFVRERHKALMDNLQFDSKEEKSVFEKNFWLLDPSWADDENYQILIDLKEKATMVTESYQNLLKSMVIEASMEEKEYLTGIIQRLNQVQTKEQLTEFFNDPNNRIIRMKEK